MSKQGDMTEADYVARFDMGRGRVHGGEPDAHDPQGHARPRKIEALIRRLVAERTQVEIATAMNVDAAAVSRYLSGECSIPLSRIDDLFAALGLRVIEREDLRFLQRRAAERLLDDA